MIADTAAALYDISAERARSAGSPESMDFNRSVVLAMARCGELSAVSLSDLNRTPDDMEYVDLLYAFLFHRTCDVRDAYREWLNRVGSQAFRRQVTQHVLSSEEYRRSSVTVLDNPFPAEGEAQRRFVHRRHSQD